MSLNKYLALKNGAEETSLVDLLTGRQNHFHLVMTALSARVIQVYSTQVLYTVDVIKEIGKEKNC